MFAVVFIDLAKNAESTNHGDGIKGVTRDAEIATS